MADLILRADVPTARLERRKQLLQSIDDQRRQLEKEASVSAMSSYYQQAFSMLTRPEVAAAFDL
ncbi:MAG TPA: hypothetical protein PKD72_04085, partial [Gemmatales bacterium]|nr:hypothetical protein [Gemmatales bacterium]